MPEILTMKKAKPIFLTGQGLPKEEILLPKEEIFKKAKVKLSKDEFERKYQNQMFYITMSNLKKYFRKHHCNWIATMIEDVLYYGFSQDYDLIQISLIREKKTRDKYNTNYQKAKRLAEKQLQIKFDFSA